MKPGDETSGLVSRSWRRLGRRRGELAEETLEGETVTARFLGGHGGMTQVTGTVGRDAAGELVVTGWADSVRRETAVPRDAQVDILKARGR
jgi:hypothetical protein